MNLFSIQNEEFTHRHIGPGEEDTRDMLRTIGVASMEELISRTVPNAIRMDHRLNLPEAVSEAEYLQQLKETSLKNKVFKNYIGQGYYDTHTPSVILRNVFENPGWYTQYTPYQAEISQGRLESLLNFRRVGLSRSLLSAWKNMFIASAAALASSSSDALVIGSAVRSLTMVWKLSRLSSLPWLISAW